MTLSDKMSKLDNRSSFSSYIKAKLGSLGSFLLVAQLGMASFPKFTSRSQMPVRLHYRIHIAAKGRKRGRGPTLPVRALPRRCPYLFHFHLIGEM